MASINALTSGGAEFVEIAERSRLAARPPASLKDALL